MMRIGLLGLSASGKTSLLELLGNGQTFQSKDGPSASSPVPDERLQALSSLYHPEKTTADSVTWVELPSLETQKGFDEKALQAIGRLDVLCFVMRSFQDPAVPHLLGSVNALRDYEELRQELVLMDMKFCETRLENLKKSTKKADTRSQQEEQLFKSLLSKLESGSDLRQYPLEKIHQEILSGYPLLSRLPRIAAINSDQPEKPPPEIPLAAVVPVKVELEINTLSPEERPAFLKDLGIAQRGLDQLIRLSIQALDRIHYFTVGQDEVRSWGTHKGATAPQAARSIHTDLEKKFIRAELISYQTFMNAGSETEAKSQGLLKLVGKDHIVQDGDIMSFRVSK